MTVKDMAPTLTDQEVEDMVSLTPKETGIQNTIFVSTKGYAQRSTTGSAGSPPLSCSEEFGLSADLFL
jgi:hypothetical protein